MIESLLLVYTLFTMGTTDLPADATCDCTDVTETEYILGDCVRREVQDEISTI